MDRSQSRRIQAEIRRVLLEVWDPIGVKDEPRAQDEYDCCLGGIYNLLAEGGTDDQIADYLFTQATDHMGLSIEKESTRQAVAALRAIRLTEAN